MKIRRHKKLHRYMSFYCNNYGFRQPYQILLDGTICFAALQHKVNIREQMSKYLEGSVKLLTTKCAIIETQDLGQALYGPLVIIKQFALHECGHDTPVVASECFQSMIGINNPNRYIVGTQDRELQEIVRNVPGTPLIYFHQKVPTFERPSEASIQQAELNIASRFSLSEREKMVLSSLTDKTGMKEEKVRKKKKKKKGANPLSCKKKKSDINKVEKRTRRRRNRIKLPKHLKEELNAQLQKLSLNNDP